MLRRSLVLSVLVPLVVGAGGATPKPRFTTPYDVVAGSGGDLWISDGPSGRVLRYDARERKLSVIARIRDSELVGVARAGKAVYVSDIRGGAVWRIDARRRSSRFARVPAATDLVLRGSTLFVGSLERGVYAIDLRTKRRRLVNGTTRPHGLALDAAGRLYAVDPPRGIYRLAANGAASQVVAVDAARAAVAADGRLYFVQSGPEGATVRRLERDGGVTRIAGTGGIGPDGEGVAATSVGLQIGAILFGRDGSLLLGQLLPRPAKIRRVDLSSGTITTVVRSP